MIEKGFVDMLRRLFIVVTVLLVYFAATGLVGFGIEAAAENSQGDEIKVDPNNNNNGGENNSVANPLVVEHITFFGLLQASGVIGYIIIFLSFVAVAIVIEFLLTARRGVLIPRDLSDNITQQLSQGQLGAAIQSCQENSSLLAKVLVAGMKEFEFGWDEVERGAEDALEKEASKLYRKIEYLNVIGNIAPMLGLLGTVVGMIIAFQQLAESGGAAKPTDLAQGIYLALVTTVEGLIVALPASGFHSILAGRIATLASDTANITEQILNPIKRSFLKKLP
ncbi:MAG: MotA/TolQ/ExbB proton channel family protein [Planctomycetaceae bacterium]|jgi:biopolymer transport protein ExbB|nr:MotA/TolQ/ExbB proton channel family protein [Planctomycetaceae bacterium]